MSKRSRSKANISIHRESLSCLLSPVFCLLPYPPILPRIHESIMQNKPNSRNDKTNATSCTHCHSDRRHATSVPKWRNLLQYCRHLPNRLFSRIYQRIMACIMQNKANFKMGKIAISTARTKAYAKEQRTMNNEHYSKQTQSKPISNAETAYSTYRTRDCHVASLLATAILNRFLGPSTGSGQASSQ